MDANAGVPAGGSARPRGLQDHVADAITAFCGDMVFVYVHVVVFAVWVSTRGFGSDHFPFNFLTMAVSLEAIFLSTFILISQNRQQAAAEANNIAVQETLLRMVQDIINDEKLDQSNEEMIQDLVKRLDDQQLRPMMHKIDEILKAVQPAGGAQAS